MPIPGGYSLTSTWFGRWCGLEWNTCAGWSGVTGIDCKRDTTGSSSQEGSGASRSLSWTRSEGHVCSRRWVSCFHLGFGAEAICVGRSGQDGNGVMAMGRCRFDLAHFIQNLPLLFYADEVGYVVCR